MKTASDTLVILIPGFPKDENDSTCLPSQQVFVRCLKSLYPELHIIVLSFQYPYHRSPYQWHGIEVIPFSGRNRGGIRRLWLRQNIYDCLKKIHLQHNLIGLLSFWYGECAVSGNRFGKKYGIRHYCWIRGQDAKKDNKSPRKFQLPSVELIALSDFLQEELERNHRTKPFTVIPPGVDTNCFPEPKPKKDIDLLAAGSLIPLKQYAFFIEVVAAVKKHIPSVRAVLAGDGPQQPLLQQMIDCTDLRENILLTGELPHREVLHLMQKSKVFVHPSSYEGFSGVCLEALAAGCHVISFCRAMKREVDQWYIVQSKKEMTEKTVELLTGEHISYKPVVPYTVDSSVEQIMKLFKPEPVKQALAQLSAGHETKGAVSPGFYKV